MRRPEFLGAVAAAGAAAAAPLLSEAAAPVKPEKSSLRIGLAVPGTSYLPIYVAAAHTWKEAGFDNQLLNFRGDAEVAQALAGDSTDINVASATGLINMINAGQPVIAFYSGLNPADFSWLSIPSVKTWSDLKGKTFGVSTFGSLTDAITRYALRKHHLEPEKDVQMVQAGGTPSAFQALKSGRIAAALISAPFKWQGPEEGLNVLGTQAQEVSPQWPKHLMVAKTKFINENPNTIAAFLRSYVAALRLARADREVGVDALMDQLKFTKPWAERAYDDVIGSYNEHGTLPDKYMPIFWNIAIQNGDVKTPWPDSRLLDSRYINSFSKWAP